MNLKKLFFNAIAVSFAALLMAYFFFPLLTMGRFAFQVTPVIFLTWDNLLADWNFESLIRGFTNPRVHQSAAITAGLTALTIAITFVVLLPIAIYAETMAPKLKPIISAITLLPWIVPPVALVVGVAATFRPLAPWFLNNPLSLSFFYAVWMLPFTYRAIEGQLRMIDVRTLMEAAQSLGASWFKFAFAIVLPNLRNALAVSSLLIIAAVTGEFTFAALMLKQTFPVYLIDLQSEDIRAGYALSLAVIFLTALLLTYVSLRLNKRGQTIKMIGV